jgi:hypothetical protein
LQISSLFLLSSISPCGDTAFDHRLIINNATGSSGGCEFLKENRTVEAQQIKVELAVVGYRLTSWQGKLVVS